MHVDCRTPFSVSVKCLFITLIYLAPVFFIRKISLAKRFLRKHTKKCYSQKRELECSKFREEFYQIRRSLSAAADTLMEMIAEAGSLKEFLDMSGTGGHQLCPSCKGISLFTDADTEIRGTLLLPLEYRKIGQVLLSMQHVNEVNFINCRRGEARLLSFHVS